MSNILINTPNAGLRVLHFNDKKNIDAILKIKTNVITLKKLILAPSTSGKSYIARNHSGLIDGDIILTDFYSQQKPFFWLDKEECKKVNIGCLQIMREWFKNHSGIVLANFQLFELPTDFQVEVVILNEQEYTKHRLCRIKEGNKSQPTDEKQIKLNIIELAEYAKKYNIHVYSNFDSIIKIAETESMTSVVYNGKGDFTMGGKFFSNGRIHPSHEDDSKLEPLYYCIEPWITTRDIFDPKWNASSVKAQLRWLFRFITIYKALYADLILIGGPENELTKNGIILKGSKIKKIKEVSKAEIGLVIIPFHKTKGYRNLRHNELVFASHGFAEIVALFS